MARVSGRLTVHDACLFLVPDEGNEYLVAWSPPSRLALIGGRVAVTDSSGLIAFVGDRVQLAGGELDASGGDPSVRVETMIGAPIPAACRIGSYWLGSLTPTK